MRRTWLSILALLCFPLVGSAATLSGMLYHDGDLSSNSHYDQTIDDNDAPLAGVAVSLIGAEQELETQTDQDGRYEFAGLGSGEYLLDFGLDPWLESTSNDRPGRVPQAVREGALHIVTIGDSIGAYGSSRLYPQRLADHFAGLCEVQVTNLAVGGSTSIDWLPGSSRGFFEQRLAPVMPEADLLTITIGGNDLDAYVQGMPPYDPQQILQNFLEHPEVILEIIPNVMEIVGAAQEINPDCDVIYVLYPNFAYSTGIQELMGSLHPLAIAGLHLALSTTREHVGRQPRIVLGDMFGCLGDTWLDPYMLDLVHANDAGHQLYADVIFECLGGVMIEGSKSEQQHLNGFYAPELLPDDDDDDDDLDDDDDQQDDDDLDDDDAADDEADDDALDGDPGQKGCCK